MGENAESSTAGAIPDSITPEVLRDVLKVSPSQRREIVAMLHHKARRYWPAKVESEKQFYELLYTFLKLRRNMALYDVSAARVEKKKKQIRLHIAFFHAVAEKYLGDDEFDECRKADQEKNSGPTEMSKWLLKKEKVDEALNFAWSASHIWPERIKTLAKENPALNRRLLSVIEHNDLPGSNSVAEGDLDEQSITWASGVSSLKEMAQSLEEGRIDQDIAEKIVELATLLKSTGKEEEERQALDCDRDKELLEEATALLAKLGLAVSLQDGSERQETSSETPQAEFHAAECALKHLKVSCEDYEEARRRLSESADTQDEEQAVIGLSQALENRRNAVGKLLEKLEPFGFRLSEIVDERSLPSESKGSDSVDETKEDRVLIAAVEEEGSEPNGEAQPSSNLSGDEVQYGGPTEAPARIPGDGDIEKDVVVEDLPEATYVSTEPATDSSARPEKTKYGAVERLHELISSGNFADAYWLDWALEKSGDTPPIASYAVGAAAEALFSRPYGMPAQQDSMEAKYAMPRGYRDFLEDAANFELDAKHSLILGGAVLPAALFARDKANQLYALGGSIRAGIQSFDELFHQVIEDFVYRGVAIGTSDIQSVSLQSADDQVLREVASRAEHFIEQIPNFNISYRPAAEGFRATFRQGAPLRRVLTTVVENRVSDRSWVRAQIDGLDPEEIIEEMVEGKKYHGRPIHQVQGAARSKILLHLEQVNDIAEGWLSIVEEDSKAKDSEEFRREKQKLIQKVRQGLAATIDDLQASDSTDELQKCVQSAATYQLRNLASLLSGELPETCRTLAQAAARLRGTSLNEELEPIPSAENYEAIISTLTGGEKATDSELIEESLGRYEYSRALLLVNTTVDTAEIPSEILEAIEKGREELKQQSDELRDQIEEANLLGLLRAGEEADEAENISRSFLIAEVERAERLLDSADGLEAVNVSRAKVILDDVKASIRQLQSRREEQLADQLQEHIDKIRNGPPEYAQDAEYLDERSKVYKKKRDLIALAELVDRARFAVQKKSPIIKTETGSSEEVIQEGYFANIEELGRHWNNPGRVAAEIQKQKTISGVAFGDKDLAYCGRAAEAFLAWQQLQASGNTTSVKNICDSVENLMGFLGIELNGDWQQKDVSKDIVWLSASVNMPTITAPIPIFGSALVSSPLEIVVSRVKRPPRELKDFLVSKKIARMPTLLIYLPSVSAPLRYDFSSLAIRHHLSVLLLDFSLFLYAAGTRDPLPAVFAVAMPLMWSQPYLMQGERVAPEMFYGRDQEVKDVLDPDGSCIVYGGRQLGKSALLRHVQSEHHDPDRNCFIVYRDIDDLGTAPQTHQEMERELWHRIARELEHCGFISRDSLPAANRKGFPGMVRTEIRRRLDSTPGSRLIVLLDEADDLVNLDAQWDFNVVKQIRGLMAETGRRFKVVFAGLQSIQRFQNYQNHAFAQLGGGTVIRPLPARAAQGLVQKPMSALGFRFEYGGLVLRILSQSNYHPGLVQIFCYRLLEYLYRTKGRARKEPIITIDRNDVAAVERNPEFMEDIRNRFDWTLDLDDRYKVLAYSLALTDEPTDLLSEDEYLELGRYWWPIVFDDMDQQTIRALLEEMVGLGVLEKETSDDRRAYRLRSPNLLRLLGPRNEVEAELLRLIVRQHQRRPNPRNYRRLCEKQPPTFGPLTMEQEAQVTKFDSPLRICVIQGSIALGLDQVREQTSSVLTELAEYEGGEWKEFRLSTQVLARGGAHVCNELQTVLKAGKRPHRFAILPFEEIGADPSPTNFVRDLLNSLKSTCRGSSKGLVVVLLNDKSTWDWICDSSIRDLVQEDRIALMSLRRWSDGAYAHALESIGLKSRSKDRGELLFKHTQGLFVLGQEVLREMAKSGANGWSESSVSTVVDRALDNERTKVSITNPYLAEATRNLLQLVDTDGSVEWHEAASLLSTEDSVLADNVLFDGGDCFRRWLQAVGLAGSVEKDSDKISISSRVA